MIPHSLFSFEDALNIFGDSVLVDSSGLFDGGTRRSTNEGYWNLYQLLKVKDSECVCPFYTHVVSGKFLFIFSCLFGFDQDL